MDGIKIPVVDSFRFLGIKITADGSLKTHAFEVLARARGLVARYRKEFYSNELSIGTKLHLMETVIISTCRYAEEINDSSVTKALQVVQNEIARLILRINSDDRARNDVSLAQLGLKGLETFSKAGAIRELV